MISARLAFFILFNCASGPPPDMQMNRWTIDGGGEMRCSGGEFELSATIAQPDAGVMTGGDFELTGGFWFAPSSGDCNVDGTVNLIDFSEFHPCVTGPNVPPGAGCTCFDIDRDNDVDMTDVARFQRSFDGG